MIGVVTGGRVIPLENIGGVAEVAQTCGVGRSVVCNWNARRWRDFPEPLPHRLQASPLWDLAEVREWMNARDDVVRG